MTSGDSTNLYCIVGAAEAAVCASPTRRLLNVRGRQVNCFQTLLSGIVSMTLFFAGTPTQAADILVADRLSNSVYRYGETGELLGTVLTDDVNLSQPTGLALSPDLQHLYVSSFQGRRVMRYDYDYSTGTASGGVVFADESNNLQAPSAILFSEDGQTIYVSNLGGVGVARFQLDGTPITPNIFFGDPPESSGQIQFSGLTHAPDGKIFVGGFQEFPSGTRGAVGLYSPPDATMSTFVPSTAIINGASGLLVHDNYLYVTGMFASTIRRFDLATGAIDSSFEVNGLAFPQALMVSPDGQGFLVGILGFASGQGHIAHYDFDGSLIGDGVFARPGGGGFTEATAFITVPDTTPGDFNRDFAVDAADLAIWMDNFGGDALLGDADENGVVDGADFLIWQRNFNAALPADVQLAPEPAGCIPALAGLGCLIWRRRSSRPKATS